MEKTTGKAKKFFSDSSFDSYFLVLLLLSLVLGFLLYALKEDLSLFALPLLVGTGIYLLTSEEYLSQKERKKKKGEREIYLSFYRNYYLFSSMFSSYSEGFEKAYELLPLSHLKDDLTDAKEADAFELPLKRSGSREETRLIDFLNQEKNQPEEPTRESLAELYRLIQAYEREEGQEKSVSVSPALLPCFLLLLFLLLPFTS